MPKSFKMSKKAKTVFPIHPLLGERWSPRAFRDESIENEKLMRIFEATRWSPSAFNEQPWRFIIGVKNSGNTYGKILSGLVDANKVWASGAPVLLVCLAKKAYAYNKKDNFHFLYDAGQSVAHLTFQAMHEDVYVHQMAGFLSEKIAVEFKVPDEYIVATVIAMGYLGNPEQLPEELQKRELAERDRKPFNEILFMDEFGKSFV